PDIIVVRHHASGAVELLAKKVDCSVINAGDGSHEHPTQALLDALTIWRNKGRIERLVVAICGGILPSRVVRSNIIMSNTLGALVMHPGPMNRGVEIDTAVADGAQSLIREQVEMGVAVRMAVLEALSRNLPNA